MLIHIKTFLEQCPWFLQWGNPGIPGRNFSTGRTEKYSDKFSSFFPTQSTNSNSEGLGQSGIPTCSHAIPCYAICYEIWIFRVTLVDVHAITLLKLFELKTNNQTTSFPQIITVPETHMFISWESEKRLVCKVMKWKYC